MKKEIIRECTNESEYNEKLRMIKTRLLEHHALSKNIKNMKMEQKNFMAK